MQTSAISNRSVRQRSLAAKLLVGLVEVAIIVFAVSFLVFNPPRLPDIPMFRTTPGVTSIGFFNASCTQRDDKHGYSYHFAKRDTRCIFAEIHFSPNMPGTLQAIFYDVNGQVMQGQKWILGNESSPMIVGVHAGQDKPGQWQPGIYRVEFLFDGKVIAADAFQISDF